MQNPANPTPLFRTDKGLKIIALENRKRESVLADFAISVNMLVLYNADNVIDYYTADIKGSYDYYSFGSPMPERTFITQSCSTQTNQVMQIPYQEEFDMGAFWPAYNAANTIPDPVNSRMQVDVFGPIAGTQVVVSCVANVVNQLDIIVTFGTNQLQIELYDPVTMTLIAPVLPIAGPPGTQVPISLNFNGPATGNVFIRIIDLMPGIYPDLFYVDLVNISALQTITSTVCWDEDYRFGFNGQEKDNQISGKGNSNTAEFWQYDTRLGRRWNLDPIDQVSLSNYVVFQNCPVSKNDPNGDVVRYAGIKEFFNVTIGRIFSKTVRDNFNTYRASANTYTFRETAGAPFRLTRAAVVNTSPAGTPAAAPQNFEVQYALGTPVTISGGKDNRRIVTRTIEGDANPDGTPNRHVLRRVVPGSLIQYQPMEYPDNFQTSIGGVVVNNQTIVNNNTGINYGPNGGFPAPTPVPIFGTFTVPGAPAGPGVRAVIRVRTAQSWRPGPTPPSNVTKSPYRIKYSRYKGLNTRFSFTFMLPRALF